MEVRDCKCPGSNCFLSYVIVAWEDDAPAGSLVVGSTTDIHFTIMTVVWHQVALAESLTNINVIHEHIVLCSESQHNAQTTGVRDRTETIFEITGASSILFHHHLTLNDKSNFAAFEFTIFPLDFVVKARGENVVIHLQGRTFHTQPNFAIDKPIHFRVLSSEPKWLQSMSHGGTTVFWIRRGARVAKRAGLRKRVIRWEQRHLLWDRCRHGGK